jgi:hypothetical protein
VTVGEWEVARGKGNWGRRRGGGAARRWHIGARVIRWQGMGASGSGLASGFGALGHGWYGGRWLSSRVCRPRTEYRNPVDWLWTDY